LAMLITPGATPQGNLYLSIALLALFEVSMFIGKRYERNSQFSSVFLFPKSTCRFCNNEVDGNSSFCPHCSKSLK
jgi:hypothetical protein